MRTLYCATLGVLLGLVFWPGLIDMDSLGQFHQIRAGRIGDWAPPPVTAVLAASMKLGGGFGAVTMAQCVLGAVGVCFAAKNFTAFLHGGRLSRTASANVGLLVAVVLLVPVSPLPYYLAQFGKDAWAVVALPWLCGLALELAATDPSRRMTARACAAGFVLAAVALLGARYNAVLVLPVLVALVAWGAWPHGRTLAAVAAAATVVAPLATDAAVRRALDVQQRHPVMQVQALDLVGVAALRPAALADFPFVAAHLKPGWREGYRWGNNNPLFDWHPQAIADPAMIDFRGDFPDSHERLAADYAVALRRYPAALLEVKARSFAAALADPAPHWHMPLWTGPTPQDQTGDERTTLNSTFALVRERLARLDRPLWDHAGVRWILGRHTLWVAAAVLLTLAAGVGALRRRDRRGLGMLLLALVPTCYDLSGLAATAQHDYRYLYPATVLLHVGALTVVGARLAVLATAVGRRPGSRHGAVTEAAAVPHAAAPLREAA